MARVCKTDRGYWVYWARFEFVGKPWAKDWKFRAGPYRFKWMATVMSWFLPNGRFGGRC